MPKWAVIAVIAWSAAVLLFWHDKRFRKQLFLASIIGGVIGAFLIYVSHTKGWFGL